jgi:hypothetical protein
MGEHATPLLSMQSRPASCGNRVGRLSRRENHDVGGYALAQLVAMETSGYSDSMKPLGYGGDYENHITPNRKIT